ncbi:MAG: EAL domain-containing protein [Atopobiaceae bacterium]|nr:EAL domain-containing protein [Atopobiaceae bacterium]MCI2173531.1 EAL domain-containing protein [Atopobiaceae bacterium]MCI2207526.1 EAL domain-containing protein [Atopobiaceae bacterium]
MPRRTILIADNSPINRAFLTGILGGEYDVLEASDGARALDVLRDGSHEVAAVLLDLLMPVMNGFKVLEEMSSDPRLSQVPVIVVTAENDTSVEVRALDAGATDFLTKPIEPEIARRRLRYVIGQRDIEELHIKSRVADELQFQSDHDALTGVYSRSAFYRETHDMLMCHPDESFDLVRWDIEKFKLVNDLFGMEVGDAVLKSAARSLATHLGGFGTYGRYGSDNFVACIPSTLSMDNLMDEVIEDIKGSFEGEGIAQAVAVAVGVFHVTDHDLSVDKMCDRAGMALTTVKGDYSCHTAYYDEKLRQRMLDEQDILDNMDAGLANEEFEVFLQPIYSLSSNSPVSAEALVRWRRPGVGIVTPSVFIPLFEHNGFISRLDHYVWEHVCRIQTKRSASGLAPIPISVNLSRRSVYDTGLFDDVVGLVERYGVDPRLFHIEVTESAYMDNAAQLINTVSRLRDYGFPVLMDDFGNGYSSFNTLKDIPVDMLKIDMRFMEGFERGGRVGTILASILRMTKWLDVPVVAEGVETYAQVRYLHSIGCDFVQGFYFAHPMPYDEFEEYILRAPAVTPETSDSYDPSDVNDVLGGDRFFDRVMDDMLDAYAVYEFDGERLEVVRASDHYLRLFAYTAETFRRGSEDVLEHIHPDDRELVEEVCHRVSDTGEPMDVAIRCMTRDGVCVCLHATFGLVGRAGTTSSLMVVTFHVIDGGGSSRIAPSCPLARSNECLKLR